MGLTRDIEGSPSGLPIWDPARMCWLGMTGAGVVLGFFLPLDEACRAAFVIVSGADARAGGNAFGAS